MITFSIIVPVYNTGKYLEDCIRSVQAQSVPDWEIILIDDGSTDESADICARIAREESRIRFFRQENRGQLATRQRGISYATGDYLLFLDSDDLWKPDLLETIKEIVGQFRPDIVLYRLEVLLHGGHLMDSEKIFDDRTVFDEDKRLLLKAFLSCRKMNSVALKAVSRSLAMACIIDDEHAFSLRRSEDMLQVMQWLERAGRVVYSDAVLYSYIRRDGSAIRTFRPEKCDDFFFSREAVKKFAIRMGADEDAMRYFYSCLCHQMIQQIEEFVMLSRERKLCRKLARDMYDRDLSKEALAQCRVKEMPCAFHLKIAFLFFKRRRFFLMTVWLRIFGGLKQFRNKRISSRI